MERDIRKCKIRYDGGTVTDEVDCTADFYVHNQVRLTFFGNDSDKDVQWMNSVYSFLNFIYKHDKERKYFEVELNDKYEYRHLKVCHILEIDFGELDYSTSAAWQIKVSIEFFQSLYPEY